MSDEKNPKLNFRAEELAVPEVLTGEEPVEEDQEEDQEEIRYDTVAVPEVHIKKIEHRE